MSQANRPLHFLAQIIDLLRAYILQVDIHFAHSHLQCMSTAVLKNESWTFLLIFVLWTCWLINVCRIDGLRQES